METSQSLIVETDHRTSFHTKIAWTVFIAIVVSAGTPKEVCMCVLVVYTGKEPGEESPKAPWRRKAARRRRRTLLLTLGNWKKKQRVQASMIQVLGFLKLLINDHNL